MRQSEKESRFMKVVNDSRQLICKVCYMYATDRDHFQDLYQEVLANIWVGLDSFRGDLAADDGSARAEQLREMYSLISGLDKLDKAIILMWLDERSYDEIAEVTGFTRNNVATRLHRIKSRLARQSNR